MTLNSIIDSLDRGKVEPLCDTCCPCGDYYVFGSVDKFLDFTTASGWIDFSDSCTGSKTSWYTNCCTETCFDELSAFLGQTGTDMLLDKGFVEYSSLGNKSLLCILLDYILQNNLTQQEGIDLIEGILDSGVVFYCNKDVDQSDGDQSNQVLASIDTFLSYANSASIFCSPQPNDPCQCYPQDNCCLTINASVATYQAWLSAISQSPATTTSTTTSSPSPARIVRVNIDFGDPWFIAVADVISGTTLNNLPITGTVSQHATTNCTGPISGPDYSFSGLTLNAGSPSAQIDLTTSWNGLTQSIKLKTLTVNGQSITSDPQTITVGGNSYQIQGFGSCLS